MQSQHEPPARCPRRRPAPGRGHAEQAPLCHTVRGPAQPDEVRHGPPRLRSRRCRGHSTVSSTPFPACARPLSHYVQERTPGRCANGVPRVSPAAAASALRLRVQRTCEVRCHRTCPRTLLSPAHARAGLLHAARLATPRACATGRALSHAPPRGSQHTCHTLTPTPRGHGDTGNRRCTATTLHALALRLRLCVGACRRAHAPAGCRSRS